MIGYKELANGIVKRESNVVIKSAREIVSGLTP